MEYGTSNFGTCTNLIEPPRMRLLSSTMRQMPISATFAFRYIAGGHDQK
jgi:hypothetical protein